MLLRQKTINLGYLKGLCKVASAKKWTKIGLNHIGQCSSQEHCLEKNAET